jgi:hypothetical protein
MLKMLVAYPYNKASIIDAITFVRKGPAVSAMLKQENKMLDSLVLFGIDENNKQKSKESTGPGMNNSPHT